MIFFSHYLCFLLYFLYRPCLIYLLLRTYTSSLLVPCVWTSMINFWFTYASVYSFGKTINNFGFKKHFQHLFVMKSIKLRARLNCSFVECYRPSDIRTRGSQLKMMLTLPCMRELLIYADYLPAMAFWCYLPFRSCERSSSGWAMNGISHGWLNQLWRFARSFVLEQYSQTRDFIFSRAIDWHYGFNSGVHLADGQVWSGSFPLLVLASPSVNTPASIFRYRCEHQAKVNMWRHRHTYC